MKHSAGEILTTHTGSLPGLDTLVPLLTAKHKLETVDFQAFSEALAECQHGWSFRSRPRQGLT